MATSYANTYGSGNRTSTVTVTATVPLNASPTTLVNGNLTETVLFFSGGIATGHYIRFQFPSPQIIDEAKFYQSTTASHATFKWQGSNDGTNFTDIGSTFTLGGATTQTITTLSGNTAGYYYYQIVRTAGVTSATPWLYEFEFKIEPLVNYTIGVSDTLTLSDSVTKVATWVRLDSIFLEALYIDPSYAVLDSIFIEILYDDYAFVDSLNNWSDAVTKALSSIVTITPITVSASDILTLTDSTATNLISKVETSASSDLNSWNDLAEELLAIHLTSFVEDMWPNWRDVLEVVMSANLFVDQSDTLTLSDEAEYYIDWIKSYSDSMSMSDSLAWTFDSPIVVSDNLNQWGDEISFVGGFSVGIFDGRLMADSVRVGSPLSTGVSDQVQLSDSVFSSILTEGGISDSFSMTDEVAVINWYYLDWIEFRGDDDYYRRYINDRGFVGGEMLYSDNDRMTQRDSILVGML